MCNYCKNVVTHNDWTDLIELNLPIEVDGHPVASIELGSGIISENNECMLETTLLFNEKAFTKEQPIKYCPMCGAKLSDLMMVEVDDD